MDLGIVIVSYNTRQLTADCLTSVYQALASDGLTAQVCVVDNASIDGSAELVSELFPQAMLIASQENLGFSGGNNLAIEHFRELGARPRHLLLLNPDTIVHAHALVRMTRFLDDHPQAGVVGAQLAFGDGSFQHGAYAFPTLWMAFIDFWPINHRLVDSRLNGRYPRRWYERGEAFPIGHPLGAALMVRWQILCDVGTLDSGYFMYCEEIDWCMRIRQAGWGIFCVPEARVTHLGGQSAAHFRDRMYVALWRSRFRLFAKHYGRLYRYSVRRIVRLGIWQENRRLSARQARGEVGSQEAASRREAYRTVSEMSRCPW